MQSLTDKPTMTEVLEDVIALIDGLPDAERKQVMAALAVRYKTVWTANRWKARKKCHPAPTRKG